MASVQEFIIIIILLWDDVQNIRERLKDFRHGTFSANEYKDKFDEFVECFWDLSNNDKQILFIMGLESSSKYV